jgi:hypothetical protein
MEAVKDIKCLKIIVVEIGLMLDVGFYCVM